jgi:hypothetical protein
MMKDWGMSIYTDNNVFHERKGEGMWHRCLQIQISAMGKVCREEGIDEIRWKRRKG